MYPPYWVSSKEGTFHFLAVPHFLYGVVSLLRVFPSIWGNLEPYSKKVNGEKICRGFAIITCIEVLFILLFVNSVQMGSDTRSPRFHRRRRTVCVRLGGWECGRQSRWAHMGRRLQKASALMSWVREVTTRG